MSRKIISAEQAANLITNGATIATGGFVGCAHPEELSLAVEQRFLKEGAPRGLTLVYAAGQGDGKDKGLNHFGHEGILKRVVGGHWNLAPKMGRLALDNKIEAYNLPQGVISHLYREIASGNPGLVTHIGLQTFVDPRQEGGKLNACTTEDIVELVTLSGREWLFYKSFPIHFALIRGTSSDSFGNISFEREAITAEALSIAQAVRNSGGTVIVQVERLVPDYSRDPKAIHIPSIFTDFIVLAGESNHRQTFQEDFNPLYVRQGDIAGVKLEKMEDGPRRMICRRACDEINKGDIVNLGIGMPEGVAQIAYEYGRLSDMTLTVEAGAVGGVPAGGLSFGAAVMPHAIMDQPYMFDFYNGGGLNVAFLGMAEADARGNVNVSKFSGRIAGIGGFMNISQTARKVVFTGTFTAGGLETVFEDGVLKILAEGKFKKFTSHVQHITFSGPYSVEKHQETLYLTERAVFRLVSGGLELIEIAPGMDVETHILRQMEFKPLIAKNLKTMDLKYFQ